MSQGILFLNYYSNIDNSEGIRINIDSNCGDKDVDVDASLFAPKNSEAYYLRTGKLSWSDFRESYINNVLQSKSSLSMISAIKQTLDNGDSVTLLTMKNAMPSFKFIIGNLFYKMGYVVIVMDSVARRPFWEDEDR